MGSPKRIAFVIPHSEPAGGERMVVELARKLDRSRFQPHAILPRTGGLQRLFEVSHIPTAVFPFSRDCVAGYPPACSPIALVRMQRQLRDWKIDLLHLNDSYLSLL